MKTKFKFKKGVHPSSNKLTASSKIEEAKIPETVVIPLQQHIGAPAEPVVKRRDTVSCGQLIGEISGFVSSNIHSSVSGVVKGVGLEFLPTGNKASAITIETGDSDSNFLFTKESLIKENTKVEKAVSEIDKSKIMDAIVDAGIVGLGGAGFPTHVKLSPPEGKSIDTLIINGAECEPFLTGDHRLMLEKPDELIQGAQLLKKALDAENCFIGIEDNKPDAIQLFKEKLSSRRYTSSAIEAVEVETIYPRGAEKILIKLLTGREVPVGGLPLDVGVVVQNISTTHAVYEAVMLEKPLYERVVTVTGEVNEPKNLLVKIGTPISQLIEECGGYTDKAERIIMGGPMMGIALCTDELPVIKTTTGIVVLPVLVEERTYPCINCNRCSDVCPMGLIPKMFNLFRESERFKDAEDYDVLSCYECGCCEYTCPSRIPIVQYVKEIKNHLRKK